MTEKSTALRLNTNVEFNSSRVLLLNFIYRYRSFLLNRFGSREHWLENCGVPLDSTYFPDTDDVQALLDFSTPPRLIERCVSFFHWAGVGPWDVYGGLVLAGFKTKRLRGHSGLTHSDCLLALAYSALAVRLLYDDAAIWKYSELC